MSGEISNIAPNVVRVVLGSLCLFFGARLAKLCDRDFKGNWSLSWVCLWFLSVVLWPLAFILLLLPVGWDWW